MKARIIRTPLAESDLLEIHDYIDDENPAAADRFLAAAEKCFEMVGRMPGSGRRWESLHPELADVRVYPIPKFRNYLVFYRPLRDGVLILTVLHGARDLEQVLNERFNIDE